MNQNKKKKKKLLWLFTTTFVLVFVLLFFTRDKLPNYFKFKEKSISCLSYEDLLRLSKQNSPKGSLSFKLQKQLSTPYTVKKYNFFKGNKFYNPFVRVAHWNIQRGFNIDSIVHLLSNNSSYFYSYRKNIDSGDWKRFEKEARDFARSDIISLNEIDIGMPRTNYRNIAAELAEKLEYNYVFATEFIELGPIISKQNIDPQKYLGLHGNAILSRYPIKNARIVRLPQMYKWFDAELKRKSPLEYARRVGSDVLFNQKILSEARHGSRCALVADIELPNKEIISVVSTHLEDRCFPQGRYKQVQYLFENIKYKTCPVVLTGDFNTSTTDSAPTSFKKEIVKRLKDKDFIARQVAFAAIPGAPIAGSLAAIALSKAFQYKDPAFVNIPVLFPNHERKLFKCIKDFKFVDGRGFDTRGDSKRSSNGKRGFLANSNERQLKGFESTFKFEEPRLIAYFKLDWFFVKPRGKRFEPFNGQTLQLINHAFPSRLSDHEPITVDLTI